MLSWLRPSRGHLQGDFAAEFFCHAAGCPWWWCLLNSYMCHLRIIKPNLKQLDVISHTSNHLPFYRVVMNSWLGKIELKKSELRTSRTFRGSNFEHFLTSSYFEDWTLNMEIKSVMEMLKNFGWNSKIGLANMGQDLAQNPEILNFEPF